MTAAETMTGDRDKAVTEYEALRSRVMTSSTAGGHSGLVVLLRQGMAAWMARRTQSPTALRVVPQPPTPCVGDELRAGLVRMLASLAMASRQEAQG